MIRSLPRLSRAAVRAVQNTPAATWTAAHLSASISNQMHPPRSTTSAATTTTFIRSQSTAPATLTLAKKERPLDPTHGGDLIHQLKKENKHIDVVRYEHKNRTWTIDHVDYWSSNLAIGFLDDGLTAGDVVLSQMPEHWSETMVLQFACSKAGMVLYQMDSSLFKTNPDAAKVALKRGLELTKANVLVSPETHEDVNYIDLTHRVIPELTVFDTSHGTVFVSPRFPHLRTCLQTGFDDEGMEGWSRLRHYLVDAFPLDDWTRDFKEQPSGKTPLLGQLVLDDKGIPTGLGPTLTNAQVLKQGAWDTYCKILKKEYHEIPGVGVVF